MDAYLKNRWIEALHCGDYAQCSNVLHILGTDKFCCLGVLRQIANPHDADEHFVIDECGTHTTTLTKPQMAKFGIGEQMCFTLARMNDDGVPFAEIADHIEKYIVATVDIAL